jgi:hypothetical protein
MRRLIPWLTAALQLTILFAAVAFATPWLEACEASLPTPRRLADVALAAKRIRPIYNASVIPGGVYSVDELRAAIEHDPVVASHYDRAVLGEMRAVTLTKGRAAYVSYRVNNTLYWTRERVWIKPGETVLTDGTTIVRARCGNCISDTRLGPVAGVEPAHGELDDFVAPPIADRGVDAFAAELEPGVEDLLAVPFGPQVYATLAPVLPAIIDDENPLGARFPTAGVPGVFLPGGVLPTSGGSPGAGPGGTGGSVPPVVFLPPDGGETSGTTGGTSSGSTGDATTASPTGTPGASSTGSPATTTGTSGDATTGTTGGATSGTPGHVTTGTTGETTGMPTGSPSGSPTSGTPVGTTGTTSGPDPTPTTSTGVVSDGTPTGNPFPTTAVATTASTTAEAPEPEMMWLLACGAIGIASRRLRRR